VVVVCGVMSRKPPCPGINSIAKFLRKLFGGSSSHDLEELNKKFLVNIEAIKESLELSEYPGKNPLDDNGREKIEKNLKEALELGNWFAIQMMLKHFKHSVSNNILGIVIDKMFNILRRWQFGNRYRYTRKDGHVINKTNFKSYFIDYVKCFLILLENMSIDSINERKEKRDPDEIGFEDGHYNPKVYSSACCIHDSSLLDLLYYYRNGWVDWTKKYNPKRWKVHNIVDEQVVYIKCWQNFDILISHLISKGGKKFVDEFKKPDWVE
jgi:hypothetical protein